jgi:V/A-type H+-transporting ATPase subunit D
MLKIKLTKGELKLQRDALRQYERYLPTLQLKKQQLQLEILDHYSLQGAKKQQLAAKLKVGQAWAGLLSEPWIKEAWLLPRKKIQASKNIAGVEIPLFLRLEFAPAEYDLFVTPLWVDAGLEALRQMITLRQEMETIEQGISILKQELRITTQRVNLFEKVKIPEAREAIRRIKIYLGDQLNNAVARAKIAKAKIEELALV